MKRKAEDMETEVETPVKEFASFTEAFTTFRQELDLHHERRERIIKVSRDITALSKKIIFALQRNRSLGTIDPGLQKQVDERRKEIVDLQTRIAGDLQSMQFYRYHRQISPAIQELVEAESFFYFLERQSLITPEEMQKSVSGFTMPLSDYLLGLYDLTGEMMRFAINNMSQHGLASQMHRHMQDLRGPMEQIEVPGRGVYQEVDKKKGVMKASVAKVEAACYSLVVRGRVQPMAWEGSNERE